MTRNGDNLPQIRENDRYPRILDYIRENSGRRGPEEDCGAHQSCVSVPALLSEYVASMQICRNPLQEKTTGAEHCKQCVEQSNEDSRTRNGGLRLKILESRQPAWSSPFVSQSIASINRTQDCK